MDESINVLVISHKYGENVYANRTNAGTQRELLTWVNYYWEDEFPDTVPPADEQERIDLYFEGQLDVESYVITTLNLKD